MKYFIANWKANKNYEETTNWINEFTQILTNDSALHDKLTSDKVSIIIAPPAPFLISMKTVEATFKNIFVGAQDISNKQSGAFTGEVTAKTLKGLVMYSILGHSERRSNYGETNEMLAEKVKLAQEENIKPILCVRDTEDTIPPSVEYVAFEPVSAIGTGNNMPLQEVLENKAKLSLPSNALFIYGGSVKPETAFDYLTSDEIDGFLIGGASLQPSQFLDIVRLA